MRGLTGRLSVAAILIALAVTGVAEAKTFEVTRKNDPAPGNCKRNDCSLREAVLAANERAGKDEIVLPEAKRYRLTIENLAGDEEAGISGDLDINNDPVSITHPGKGRAKITNQVADDRVIHIQAGAPTRVTKVTVSGGDNGDEDGGGFLSDARLTLTKSSVVNNIADDGAGIDMDGAGLTLKRSKVLRNDAEDLAGGINTSGDNDDTLILRSRIAGNTSVDTGGGLDGAGDDGTIRVIRSRIENNSSGGGAGGFDADATRVVIKQSTIAGNSTDEDGGGLFSTNPGTLRISASTISGNRATGGGSDGGGIYVDGPDLSITNSTLSGNAATLTGGGIVREASGGAAALNAVTIARNIADTDGLIPGGFGGGGLYRAGASPFEVRNSLIALNLSSTSPNDCDGSGAAQFDSLGNNLLSTLGPDASCEGFDGPGDIVRANPKIGKLKRNGGSTKTVALKAGSPAIGRANKPSSPKRDQRGVKRDNDPDIGAFER